MVLPTYKVLRMMYYATLEVEDVSAALMHYFGRGWVVRMGSKPNEVVIYAARFGEVFCELLEIHGCNEATISREKVIELANLVNRL